ncbi:MAG: hypothetical protein Q9M82_02320 [Mariprofundus sp.]|nr:hypothetical protein [Mariprofundus sp.]
MKDQLVTLSATSDFGKDWIKSMGQLWQVRKITDHVLFSNHPGPWMLLEQNHFERWINLNADRHFLIHWSAWR